MLSIDLLIYVRVLALSWNVEHNIYVYIWQNVQISQNCRIHAESLGLFNQAKQKFSIMDLILQTLKTKKSPIFRKFFSFLVCVCNSLNTR